MFIIIYCLVIQSVVDSLSNSYKVTYYYFSKQAFLIVKKSDPAFFDRIA